MKILSSEQIKEAEKLTMQNGPLSSVDLMERAAQACTNHIISLLGEEIKFIHIVCGKGNNGGDGLAIARLLEQHFEKTKNDALLKVFIIEHSINESADFTTNLKRLKKKDPSAIVQISEQHKHNLTDQLIGKKGNALIIDAIFGYGLNKAVSGVAAEIIDIINRTDIPVISIDLPSGLFPDKKTIGEHDAVIRASLVLTFQSPKLAFMMAENGKFCSDFVVLDIGLDKEFISRVACDNFYMLKDEIRPMMIPREKFSHKGNFGHALLLAGSYGKIGAAELAAKSCLRSGAGLLTVHLPACGISSMQNFLPEAMVSADDEEKFISSVPRIEKVNAVGAGPGIGTDHQTANVIKLLIQNFNVPMVLDADALNILSENKTWLAFLKPNTILTPHPKEFDRIAGAHSSDFDRLESAKDLAFRHSLIIILKGAHTAIVTPAKKVFFNSSGNPGMAKGGSGDVLTGMITGLLARGYAPLAAAMAGVFLHGHAGDIAAQEIHEDSMLASDLIESISHAFYSVK